MTFESAAKQEIARLNLVAAELERIHAVKLGLVQSQELTGTVRAVTLDAAEADRAVSLAGLFPYSLKSYDLEVHYHRSQWKNLAEPKGQHPADFQSDASEKQRTVLQDRAVRALNLFEVRTVAGSFVLSGQILCDQY